VLKRKSKHQIKLFVLFLSQLSSYFRHMQCTAWDLIHMKCMIYFNLLRQDMCLCFTLDALSLHNLWDFLLFSECPAHSASRMFPEWWWLNIPQFASSIVQLGLITSFSSIQHSNVDNTVGCEMQVAGSMLAATRQEEENSAVALNEILVD
jgi:hypothetical protein